MPLDITTDDIEWVASKLLGSTGVGGTDAVNLRNWLLRHGTGSAELREELAAWADWLANSSPPWAAYRAMMAGWLVVLDKRLGTWWG